jgi:two-component system nitrate/nitrite response regulator NarL
VARILVVSPVRIYRESLAAALCTHVGVAVIGTAATPEEVARESGSVAADVILVDVSTARAVLSIALLKRACPAAGLVALAFPEDDDRIVACAAAGVAGFVACEATLDDVVTTAEAVARGDVACSPRVTAALLRRVGAAGRHPDPRADGNCLTTRERQVLDLIDDGLSNKEIASRLYIEVSTVKNHVHSILGKLGARRRSEAAAHVRLTRDRR